MRHPSDALVSACAEATSTGDLFASLSSLVRKIIPFDGSAWFALDPSTLLVTAPVRVENVEEGHCQSYWERECRVQDALLYRDLARSVVPAGSLLDATNHQPDISPRYREYLAPQNYGDEIRAALRIQGRTWAAIDLYREQGRRPFTDQDVQLLTRIGPAIATSLRSLAVTDDVPTGSTPGSGIALFDRQGRLLSLDPQAEYWFTTIGGPQWRQRPPSTGSIWAVVSRAANVREGRDWGAPMVRLKTPSRGWLTLSASAQVGVDGSAASIAVSVTPARGPDIAPLLTEAFGLTARERQTTEAVARGLSNQEIAAEMHLSAHTVRDHLKAVFAKLDVSSRSELTAKLFADHYGPALHDPSSSVVIASF